MRLLIVGSLEGYMGAASKIALQRGAKVSHANTLDVGLATLRDGKGAELVFVDVKLDISRFMQSLEAERISTPVVACGIGSDSGAAVRAIKAGAREYLPLPPDPDLIAAVLAAVSEERNDVIANDAATKRIFAMADQIARSDATVLVSGESGTGKEVISRFVHAKSRRANAHFVSVNCAAIPENLLESELFGHEKGAFTGAVARRVGKFEEADGGTLLLDEITEMHPRLQAKLLRAIQEREIDRVGGTHPVKVDIRLICTTNRALEEEVRAGNFREDLYFRINVVNLRMPALRERPKDIAALARHFAERYAQLNEVPVRPLSDEALERLMMHSWPGNVRELENTLHRAVLMAQGDRIEPEAILLTSGLGHQTEAQANAFANAEGLVGRTVAAVERDLIIDTLRHCLGNRTHAATILGISIRTLRNKLRQYADEGVAVPPPASVA